MQRILRFLIVLACAAILLCGTAIAGSYVRDVCIPEEEETSEHDPEQVQMNTQAVSEPSEEESVRERPEPPMDEAFVSQVERIREDGYIPRIAAPTENLNVRERADTKSAELGSVPPGTLLAQISEKETGGRTKVRVAGSGLTGYISTSFAPVIEYPAMDPSLLPVVDVHDALYTYEEMMDDIEELAVIYGDVLSVEISGESIDGRQIPQLVLGNPEASAKIFIQAGIHGREYMTSQLVMKLTEYYACYAHVGSFRGVSYEELLKDTAFFILPMTNPDGVSISQLGEAGALSGETRALLKECYERDRDTMVRFTNDDGEEGWYDNYRGSYNSHNTRADDVITFEDYLVQWKANARGVDLNNNFDVGWEEVVGKKEPSFAAYPGPAPCSEPETAILCEAAWRFDYAATISYHARGTLIYYDSDGKLGPAARKSLALAELLRSVNGYPLVTEHSSTMNLGGFTDWLQFVKGRESVTVEIGKYQCPLDISEFLPIWYRNRETWAALAMEHYEEEK